MLQIVEQRIHKDPVGEGTPRSRTSWTDAGHPRDTYPHATAGQGMNQGPDLRLLTWGGVDSNHRPYGL